MHTGGGWTRDTLPPEIYAVVFFFGEVTVSGAGRIFSLAVDCTVAVFDPGGIIF